MRVLKIAFVLLLASCHEASPFMRTQGDFIWAVCRGCMKDFLAQNRRSYKRISREEAEIFLVHDS